MSDFRTYRAETMQEALRLVREDLGPNALIFHTRQIPRKGKFPWQKERVETEIVAIPDDGQGPAPTPQRRRPAAAPVHNEQQEEASAPDLSVYQQRPARTSTPVDSPITEERPRQETAAPAVQTPKATREARPRTADELESRKLERLVSERLDAMQKMVEQLTAQVNQGVSRDIPPELFTLYTELMDAEVEESLARELITRLKTRCDFRERNDPETLHRKLFAMIESDVRCSGPIKVTPGQTRIAALVGPTGVGKTTTIAKLAANFRLRDNIRMGLITVDTYRIAAVEQLRTYAEIIDLPMKVVTSAAEMKQAVNDLAGMDLILIDTAGRSPQDDLKLQELKSVLSEIVVDEIHLVLSATAGYRHLRTTVEKFQSIHPTSTILTKLDEAPGLGSIINVGQLGLPLSYFTTGQNVPHDIEPAHATRATRLVLGQERVDMPTPV